jgi:S1/P1 Nuclease
MSAASIRRWLQVLVASAALAGASSACAWSDMGHAVTALIAYRHLTPQARAILDRLLASDRDGLTQSDFASRASWADYYRINHHESSRWHFIDMAIDAPDMDAACFHFPRLTSGQPASQGVAEDCIVNKIDEFYAELKDPGTPAVERLLALKYLLHFIGDLHQPLHAADHLDRGGNCVGLAPPIAGSLKNLHAYWDVAAVSALGHSAESIAATLDEQISAEDRAQWSMGNSHTWAQESYELGKRDAYSLPILPTCQQPGAVTLSDEYQRQAAKDAALQLKRAGIRIAILLNGALGKD